MSSDTETWQIFPALKDKIIDSEKRANLFLKAIYSDDGEARHGALVYVKPLGYVFEYNAKLNEWQNTFRSPHELLVVMARIHDISEFNKKMSQFEGRTQVC